MTTLTPPTLPSDFLDPPKGPIVYAFEPLWGAGTPVCFPRLAYEWDPARDDHPRIVKVPDVPGAWDVDGTGWHFGGSMDLSIRFKVQTASERRKILSGCKGPGRLWLIDEASQYYWSKARLKKRRAKADIYDEEHDLYPVILDFVCPSGVWFAPTDTSGSRYGYAKYGVSTYGSASRTFTLSGTSAEGEIINEGNLPAMALLVTLTASGGSIVDPTITNLENGQDVTYTGTLTTGNSWVLDTAQPSLTKAGSDDWDNLTVGSNQQGLIWLIPGSNTIQVSSGSTLYGSISFTFWSPYDV